MVQQCACISRTRHRMEVQQPRMATDQSWLWQILQHPAHRQLLKYLKWCNHHHDWHRLEKTAKVSATGRNK
jgi:hypothetical protein